MPTKWGVTSSRTKWGSIDCVHVRESDFDVTASVGGQALIGQFLMKI